LFVIDSGIAPVKETYSQIEVDTHFENLVVLPDDHFRYETPPPIRILSFDIEVLVGDDVPRCGNKQVIQIGNILGNYSGEGGSGKCVIY
jgi:hypothetical protein